MIIPAKSGHRGIALIIVMIVITFFSILVAGFAYSMKVETRLARNSGFDSEMDWLGRSGVELAKYVIGVQRTIPNEASYDSLNQKWAGGPGNSNSILADVQLENNVVGRGTFSVKITDCERKININKYSAQELVMNNVLAVIGVDASETGPIINSIADWIDDDDNARAGGAENSYYESLGWPYSCKNGPIDDINELLLVNAVTPELFWGPRYSGPPSITRRAGRFGREPEPITYSVGLGDVFTPFGIGMVNVNTASSTVLQICPGIDENIAGLIIQQRAGLDGMDGTEDDTPFRNAGEIMRIAGMAGMGPPIATPGVPMPLPAGGTPQPGQPLPFAASPIMSFFSVQSFTFEVEVQVTLNDRRRTYYAILRRVDQKNVQILNIWWR